MRFSVITPSYNSGRFLEATIKSILKQRESGIELEYIVLDGGSQDETKSILRRYESEIDHLIIEPDSGPANAINKGLQFATGDIVSWLNADDLYYPGTLQRVAEAAMAHPQAALYFGGCPIVDEQGLEIRDKITRFKEFFFPISSRFTYQCINYLSQPALFFSGDAVRAVGPLREDMVAAWDYEYILRFWQSGSAVRLPGPPLAAFRWHEGSISGQNFGVQFKEEYDAAKADAGSFSLQTMIHFMVRWGIVGMYELMARNRKGNS